MNSPRPLSTDYRKLIVNAALAGIPPIWIAAELGTTNNSIKSILSQERARGVEIPRFRDRKQLGRHLKFDADRQQLGEGK